MTRRIGILGGTFDPVHLGHLIVGQEVLTRCALDEMLLMPSGEPPHKAYPEMASAPDRAEMVRLALADHPVMTLSRFEVERPGKSYTVHTLRTLREYFGAQVALFLVIGADNAVEMRSWCNPEGVLDLAQVVVASRPGFDVGRIDPVLRKQMQFVETPLLEIASTQIRRRVQQGAPIRFWVPDAVAQYIDRRGLYR